MCQCIPEIIQKQSNQTQPNFVSILKCKSTLRRCHPFMPAIVLYARTHTLSPTIMNSLSVSCASVWRRNKDSIFLAGKWENVENVCGKMTDQWNELKWERTHLGWHRTGVISRIQFKWVNYVCNGLPDLLFIWLWMPCSQRTLNNASENERLTCFDVAGAENSP